MSRSRNRFRTTYAWLPFGLLGLILLTLVIMAAVAIQIREQFVASAGHTLALAAETIADKLDGMVVERYGDIQVLASTFTKVRDPHLATRSLQTFHRAYPVYQWLAVTDTAGIVRASTNPAHIGTDESASPWFQSAQTQSQPVVQYHQAPSAQTKQDTLSFTMAISDEQGRFSGIVTAHVRADVLLDIFQRTVRTFGHKETLDRQYEWELVSPNGHLLHDSWHQTDRPSNLDMNNLPSVQLLHQGLTGSVEETQLRTGQTILTGYAQTRGLGPSHAMQWGVLVRLDRRAVLAPIFELLQMLAYASLFTIGPALGALIWTMRRLQKDWGQLQASEQKLDTILETIRDGVMSTDRQGRIVFLNHAAQRITGWSKQTAIGQPVANLLVPAEGGEPARSISHLAETGATESGADDEQEHSIVLRDGSIRTVALTTAPLAQEDGTISGTVIACRDITAKKESEREQERTRAFLQSVFDNIPHMITVRDAVDLQFVQINKAGEDLLGRTNDQLLGKNISECFPEDQAAQLAANDREVVRANRRIDLPDDRLLSPRDGLRRMHTIKVPIADRQGHPEFIMTISQDITERTEAEDALQASQQLLDQIMNSAGEGIISLDLDGRIEFANAAALTILGYGLHELHRADLHDLTHYAKEDGSPYQRRDCPIYQTLKEGHVAHSDTEVFWCKNGTCVPVEYLSTPKQNEQGTVTGCVLTFRDITLRKQADQKLLDASNTLAEQNAILAESRDQAMQSAKAKSEFLISVSHELRTPMNTIIGMTELLKEAALPDEARNHVARISRSSDNLLRLIDNILDITNASTDKLTLQIAPFDLRALAESSAGTYRTHAQGKGLDLVTIIDPALPPLVLGDEARLRQIFGGLLDNAVKFTSRGTVIFTIESEVANQPSGNILIMIADTGIGIPDDKLTEIFNTFTQVDGSNTRSYGGLGIGLSLVKRLVELMGGRVQVESHVGQGSTFSFSLHLPSGDGAPGHGVPPPGKTGHTAAHLRSAIADGLSLLPEDDSQTKPRQILIVDDLEDNRDVVKLFLKDLPYVLAEAENGAIAVEMVQTGSYDLILMDMQMPVMDGYTATSTIRKWEQVEQRTPTPIVALTADALKEDLQKGLACGCSAYLTKPARKKMLLDMIRACLHPHAGPETVRP